MTVLPHSAAGRRSAIALGLAVLTFAWMNVLVALGQTGPDFNPWLASALGVMFVCLLASGVFAAIAVVRQHERAALTLLALGAGAVAILFAAGEALGPH